MSKVYYAIGDIHGMYFQLIEMVKKIETHVKENEIEDYEIISLGDIIDRGQDSNKCVEFIMNHPKFSAIRGNHEEFMMWGTNIWWGNGGIDTVRSYPNGEIFPDHFDYLTNLPSFLKKGEYFFVHAGVDLSKSIEDQKDEVMMMTRNFVDRASEVHKDWEGVSIVHGHTPNILHSVSYRNTTKIINIDTGCCFVGKLTCAICEKNKPVTFMDVTGPSAIRTLKVQ